MADINIKTTLGINPRKKLPTLFVIMRGATAELTYNLLDKWFNYELIEQLTFTFKQKKQINYYNMFKYLLLTEDTEVNESKRYYKNVSYIDIDKSYECTGELVINPAENPHAAGYYEEVTELEDSQNNLRYIIDSHFKHIIDDEHDYIVFMFSSAETSKLSPTSCGAEMQFEIAIRFNTDSWDELANHDSIIIETQPSIIVKDSLYGQAIAITNTVSDNPEWLASTRWTVKE